MKKFKSFVALDLKSNAQNINIGTGAAARTITVGNDSSTKVDINALDIELDAGANGVTINSAGAIDITTSASNSKITIDPGLITDATLLHAFFKLDKLGRLFLSIGVGTQII